MADSTENLSDATAPTEALPLSAASQAQAERVAAAVDAVITHEHGPNHVTSTHAAEVGAIFLALGGASEAAAKELHDADTRAISAETAALTTFKKLSAAPNPVVPFAFRSYSHPERLAYEGPFHGSTAHAYAAIYTLLMEEGIGSKQGIDHDSLLLADQLYDLAESDPELMASLFALGAESGATEAQREYWETAHGTVEAGKTHSVKERLGALVSKMHGESLLELPIVERARQLGEKALHLGAPAAPYGGVVLKHVEDLGHNLNAQEANAARWMGEQTNKVIAGVLGAPAPNRGSGLLEAVIQGMQIGRNSLVPATANRAELGRALLTRAALRYPDHVFADDATGTPQEIGLYLTLAAMFDVNERPEESALQQYFARQKQAAKAAVTTNEMADAQAADQPGANA